MASSGENYLWGNGDTSSFLTISPITTTVYSVVASIGSCTDTSNAVVIVESLPSLTVSNNFTIFQGQDTLLKASGGNNYSWSNGATDSVIAVAPTESTVYCVTVSNTSVSNCTNTACINVSVEPVPCGKAFIPSIFSPNNDGRNDLLYVRGSCITKLQFAVYNRWGEKVFETTDKTIGWDGAKNGKPMNPAVFVYYAKIIYEDGTMEEQKGNITLIK